MRLEINFDGLKIDEDAELDVQVLGEFPNLGVDNSIHVEVWKRGVPNDAYIGLALVRLAGDNIVEYTLADSREDVMNYIVRWLNLWRREIDLMGGCGEIALELFANIDLAEPESVTWN